MSIGWSALRGHELQMGSGSINCNFSFFVWLGLATLLDRNTQFSRSFILSKTLQNLQICSIQRYPRAKNITPCTACRREGLLSVWHVFCYQYDMFSVLTFSFSGTEDPLTQQHLHLHLAWASLTRVRSFTGLLWWRGQCEGNLQTLCRVLGGNLQTYSWWGSKLWLWDQERTIK